MSTKYLIASVLSLSLLNFSAFAKPVNVNLASSGEIEQSLELNHKVAAQIQLDCEYRTCRSEQDLMKVQGMTPEMAQHIRKDVIYSIMERGTSTVGDY